MLFEGPLLVVENQRYETIRNKVARHALVEALALIIIIIIMITMIISIPSINRICITIIVIVFTQVARRPSHSSNPSSRPAWA